MTLTDIATLLAAGVSRCFTTAVGLLDIVEAVRGATRPLVPSATTKVSVSGSEGDKNEIPPAEMSLQRTS